MMADNLTSIFTKALGDLLSQNESRFVEQAKFIEDLQKQVVQLRSDLESRDAKLEEQEEKLAQVSSKLNEQTVKLKEQSKKLNEQTHKLNEQTNKLNDQTIELEEEKKFNEKFEIEIGELRTQIDKFKNIKLEDICEWIKFNTKLGHEVMNLLESRKNTDERVKTLLSTQRKHQQLLDSLTRNSSVQSPFRQPVKSPSVSSYLNGNTTTSLHQHNSTPRLRFAADNQPPASLNAYQRSPYYSVEPEDELSQLGDEAESLIRTVDGLNLLHRSFDKNSINSDE